MTVPPLPALPPDAVATLIAAALSPVGSAERAHVGSLLAPIDPDRLPFAGWRALLLLDDELTPGSPWRTRTDGLRRRSFAAAAVASRLAANLSAALTEAGIVHACTGELPLAWRHPRPGDRPVHGITVIVGPRARSRRVDAALDQAGIAPIAPVGRRSRRARIEGLDVLVHRGWPRAAYGPRVPITCDPRPPSVATAPIVDRRSEAWRIRCAARLGEDPARRLDLAVLGVGEARSCSSHPFGS